MSHRGNHPNPQALRPPPSAMRSTLPHTRHSSHGSAWCALHKSPASPAPLCPIHLANEDGLGEDSLRDVASPADRLSFAYPFMQRPPMQRRLLQAALAAALALHPLAAAPLKVHLMAGQSNMQGFCAVHTFPQIEADPVTRPIYQKLVNPDGTPRVHENIWISTSGCAKDESPGQLTAGYGGGRKGRNIGPELTFGMLGFNGELETERYRQIEPKHIPWLREFRKAMAAPTGMPEYKDQVAAVRTEEFWEPRLEDQ